jgi:hypothetical protein
MSGRFILSFVVTALAVFLAACTPGPLVPAEEAADLSATISVTRIVTPTETPLPPLQPHPDYIVSTKPAAATVIEWNEYASDPNASMICVELSLATLVEPGDHFIQNEIAERTTLFVNDKQSDEYPKPREHTIVIEGEEVVLDDYHELYTFSQVVDRDGQVIASWEGEGLLNCWLAELLPGTHEAEFQFRQTSGTVQSYRWFFTLMEP